MSATFPNGIASFTQKQDNFDVNHAADINRLQEEIVAIESAIGALITTVTDLSTEVTTDEQNEATFENQTTTKFKTLGDRLAWLQNGYHIRAARASGSEFASKPINDPGKFQGTLPDVLKLDAPPVAADPYGLYNGTGFTLNKSGFWLLVGNVRVDVGDSRITGDVTTSDNHAGSSKNQGAYQAAIEWGGNWVRGMDRKEVVPDGTFYPNMFLNPVYLGWFNAGTKVSLRFSQSSAYKQAVRDWSLSAVWFRAPGQSNVSP
jgi:hypothetical protein